MDCLSAKWSESPVHLKSCLPAESSKLTCAFIVTGTKINVLRQVLDISVTIRWCLRQLTRKPDTSFLFPLLSACDTKPAGLKALNPASTPVQCGSTHPTGPQPVKRDLQPPAPQLTNNCPPSHIPALSPSHHHNIPQANQSQHFALPRPSISCPSASFNSEPRWVLTHTFCLYVVTETKSLQTLNSCSSTFQVSAAAVGALCVFPPSGESEQTVPALELWWTTTVPATPFRAPGFPWPPRFQTGFGGPAIPRTRVNRARCGPAPNCLQPCHNQTRAERLWLRLRCVDYYILENDLMSYLSFHAS